MGHEPVSRPTGIVLRMTATLTAACLGTACSSESTGGGGASLPESRPSLQIVTVAGGPLEPVAGDALRLKVVGGAADGSISDLPVGSQVTWASPSAPVKALPPDSDAPSPMPAAGAQPTLASIANPSRPERAADLTNVLFILDPGTEQNAVLQVSATVTGSSSSGNVSASLNVAPTPAGDWTRGATLYGPSGANCAMCHGPSGHGSPVNPDGTYGIGGTPYEFPAPGLNAEPGNAASDPAWNAALFTVASRADVDNGGISLRLPMPDWLDRPGPTGQPLTTQDFADIFSFLKTQTH